jgi:hypothetical protein
MSDSEKPSGTFSDYSETNSNTFTNTRRDEICQRSGFRVDPRDLVTDRYGLKVLPKFRDSRHPQERPSPAKERGGMARRPEGPDVFIGTGNILITGDGFYISTGTGGNILTGSVREVRAEDL